MHFLIGFRGYNIYLCLLFDNKISFIPISWKIINEIILLGIICLYWRLKDRWSIVLMGRGLVISDKSNFWVSKVDLSWLLNHPILYVLG